MSVQFQISLKFTKLRGHIQSLSNNEHNFKVQLHDFFPI